MKCVVFTIIFLLSFQSIETNILNFTEGMLQGLIQNSGANLTDILKCVEGVFSPSEYQLILGYIESAVSMFKHLDIAHWEDIYKGFEQLFDAVFELYRVVKPCIAGVKELESIIKLLEDINPAILLSKITKNLVFHGYKLVSDLVDIVHQYQKGNWKQMGFDTGDIVYNLLIS